MGAGDNSNDITATGVELRFLPLNYGSIENPYANDVIPPVFINCPQNITLTLPSPCSGASCGSQVYWTQPTATDNCSSVSLTSNYNPEFFPVATTGVIYTATDAAGNKSNCVFTVTIQPFKIDNHLVNSNKGCLIPNGSANGAVDFTDGSSSENWAAASIFPNPADCEAFVDLFDYSGAVVTLAIADLAGKVLFVEKIDNAGAEPHRLDVSKLRSGTYFVTAQTEGRRSDIRKLEIIKQ